VFRPTWLAPLTLLLALAGPALLIVGVSRPFIRLHPFLPFGLTCAAVAGAFMHARARRGVAAWANAAVTALIAGLFYVAVGLLARIPDTGRSPAVGETAPRFALRDSQGDPVSLGDLLQSGPKLLVFFRGTWGMVCRAELQGLGAEAVAQGLPRSSILAISADEPAALGPWQEKLGEAVRLLSDRELSAIRDYGLLHPRAFQGRDAARPAHFVIGQDGRIIQARRSADTLDRSDPREPVAALRRAAAR